MPAQDYAPAYLGYIQKLTSRRGRRALFAATLTLFSSVSLYLFGNAGNLSLAIAAGPMGPEQAAFSAAQVLPPAAPDPHAETLRALNDPVELYTLRSLLEGDEAARETGTPTWLPVEEVRPDNAPGVNAKAYFVADSETGEVLLSKNSDRPYPIASISKLMGGMVYADAQPDLEDVITLSQDDKDYLQITRSRLRVGYQYRASDLLFHSLLPSDNRATVALMRQTLLTPERFKEAMNRRAQSLGIKSAHFEEPTGLDSNNVASARDVATLLEAALVHTLISRIIKEKEYYYFRADAPVLLGARSSNRLSHMEEWGVVASKTGFTYAAGSCLVQQMRLSTGRLITMSILGAPGEKGRYPAAAAIRSFLEGQEVQVASVAGPEED
ncbi:MAG: D-alanyl-D-alanine carboxypeptidase family protein [Myxococcota bacterium]